MPKAPGQSTWQSDAPKAEHRAAAFFHAPNSGSSKSFEGKWHGDQETSLSTVNSLLATGQSALTNYVVTRAALGTVESELHDIENDLHPKDRSRLGPPDTRRPGPPLGLPAGARPMPGPTPPLALGPAPVPIPLGPGVDAGRPKFPAMGARGPRTAPDARKTGGGSLSYPNAIQIDPGTARRKGTGGNDRRLKGLITSQLNDRLGAPPSLSVEDKTRLTNKRSKQGLNTPPHLQPPLT